MRLILALEKSCMKTKLGEICFCIGIQIRLHCELFNISRAYFSCENKADSSSSLSLPGVLNSISFASWSTLRFSKSRKKALFCNLWLAKMRADWKERERESAENRVIRGWAWNAASLFPSLLRNGRTRLRTLFGPSIQPSNSRVWDMTDLCRARQRKRRRNSCKMKRVVNEMGLHGPWKHGVMDVHVSNKVLSSFSTCEK